MEVVRSTSQTVQETAASAVRLEGISKRFGATVAVADVTLDLRSGEFFSLLGPSGCGKTTLLRVVAGFEQPDAGRVYVHGTDVTSRPPQERPTAMVFQSYALFPTMTVGENVAYGLRVRRLDRAARKNRVQQALARVGLEALTDRPVTQLSGGQQQRVAVARALAVEPRVLLFDEPLSNLDAALREQTRRQLKLLQQELGVTSLYVTHDQQEALALSDRIAVLREGRLQQVGTPQALYHEPDTAFVAQFLGGSNLIRKPQLAARLTGGEPPSHGYVLSVRPEHLNVQERGPVQACVKARQFHGLYEEWWLEAEGQLLRAWVEPGTRPAETVTLAAVQHRWVHEDE